MLYLTIIFENKRYYLADEVDKEEKSLQDKIHRRNMQINDLKKRVAELETFNNTFGDRRN